MGAASPYFTQSGRLGNGPEKKTPAKAIARPRQPPREDGSRYGRPSPLLPETIVYGIVGGEKNQPAGRTRVAIETVAVVATLCAAIACGNNLGSDGRSGTRSAFSRD
jgi:hypothetical protein